MLHIINTLSPKYDKARAIAVSLVIGILAFVWLSVGTGTVAEQHNGLLFALSAFATALVVVAHKIVVKRLDRQHANLVSAWASS